MWPLRIRALGGVLSAAGPNTLLECLRRVSPRRAPHSLQPLPPGCHRNRPTKSRPASRYPAGLPFLHLRRASPPLRIGPSGNAAGRLGPLGVARAGPVGGVCRGSRPSGQPPLTAPGAYSAAAAPRHTRTARARANHRERLAGRRAADSARGARHQGKRGLRGSQPAPHPAAPSSARLTTWVLRRDASPPRDPRGKKDTTPGGGGRLGVRRRLGAF